MNAASEHRSGRYRIGDLVLDQAAGRVSRAGESLKVTGLTYDMLVALVEAAPSMLTYDELCERVWGGRATSPETMAQRAKMLRQALSDDARAPRYFELVRGRGYRLVASVELLSDVRQRESKTDRRWHALFALVAIVAVVVVLSYLRDAEPPRSVAVLPFEDLSERGDQQYLADGVAEELISELSELDCLDVASRTESFFYRGPAESLRTIGRKLGVSAILEGSVRKSGDQLRITVQLINVADGFHLWSENYERKFRDIFAIQQEIAGAVAGALGVRLGVGGVNEFRGAGTQNLEAYEAFLKGNYRNAIELDPAYAAAWSRLGVRTAGTMWRSPPEDAPAIMREALSYSEKAMQLDPQSARVNTDFAVVTYVTLDWNRAQEAFDRALELRRSASNVDNYGNMLMRVGRSTEALGRLR